MEEATIIKTKKNTKNDTESRGSRKLIFSKRKTIKILFGIVFLAILAIAIYSSYMLYRVKDPDFQKKQSDEKTQKIISQVGKLYDLPQETPQVATVADVDALKKTQPFFEKAVNGDQILIYTNQAIIYRPSTNKIMNVGTVNRTDEKTVPKPVVSDILDTDTRANAKDEK
jgi:hypothetical protein